MKGLILIRIKAGVVILFPAMLPILLLDTYASDRARFVSSLVKGTFAYTIFELAS